MGVQPADIHSSNTLAHSVLPTVIRIFLPEGEGGNLKQSRSVSEVELRQNLYRNDFTGTQYTLRFCN